MSISLQIIYKGQPVCTVPEYSEVELHLVNQGQAALSGLSVWLTGLKIRDGMSLRPGSEFVTTFNVSDWVGELTFSVQQTTTLVEADVSVTPRKLTMAEVWWIKTERLPALLARLEAPNRLQLNYTDQAPEVSPFDFVSADYTAQRLRYFCQAWLELGLGENLVKRLDFGVEERERREEGFIRGQVRWNPTITGWQNRPVETGLVHQWVESNRDYDRPLNRLLVFFLQALATESLALVRLVRQGAPASARLKDNLTEFEAYARDLERLWQNRILVPVVENVVRQGFKPTEIEAEVERAANPAYRRMVELWREYQGRYVRLPTDDKFNRAGLQPLSQIYELWVACEAAAALEMSFLPGGLAGLESAVFQNEQCMLYYNQGAPDGWYSAGSRKQPPRPDLRLVARVGPPQNLALLDVKYRTTGDGHAQPDDMYRMLAYMNDLTVERGAIIFPGQSALPQLKMIAQPGEGGQYLAEMGLRPPDPADLPAWQTGLKQVLRQFLDKQTERK